MRSVSPWQKNRSFGNLLIRLIIGFLEEKEVHEFHKLRRITRRNKLIKKIRVNSCPICEIRG